MPTETESIAFGAKDSPRDYRTLTSDMMPDRGAVLEEHNLVRLDHPCVDELCNQKSLGICTKCAVRMAAEVHFADGIRLDEYWGYLIGKLLIEGNLNEGSSAFVMLKAANKYGIPTQAIREQFPLRTTGSYKQFIEDFNEKYKGKIPAEVLADAVAHKIPGYYAIAMHPAALAKEVAEGRLPIIRMRVGENFYTDKNGKPTRDGKKLFPLRKPKVVESGHLMAMNEQNGLTVDMVICGPNSWSKTWGNEGFYEFVFKTHFPEFFTEAWAIADSIPEVITTVKQLPEAKDFKYTFPRKIEFGMQNEDVKQLHIALAILGYLNVALNEWGIYGKKTAAAVLAYQKHKKLLPVAQLDKFQGYYVHELTLNALRKEKYK